MAGLTTVLCCDNGGAGTWGDSGMEGLVTVSFSVITGAEGNCKRFSVILLLKVLSEKFLSDIKGGADGSGIT